MFGYVIPCKMEMKIKDFELFRAYYCGLCKSIKKSYGNLPRLTLNYDMTFLAILIDGLDKNKITTASHRCIANRFIKKSYVISNDAIEYAAFMNVALVYFKYVDDKNDDNSLKGASFSFLLKRYFKKFPSKLKNNISIIQENLSLLSEMEKKDTNFSIDEISHPFAKLTGAVLSSYTDETNKDSLFWLGYNLGKWIYLIDAFDDLEKDINDKKFNPLLKALEYQGEGYLPFKNKILKRIEFNLLTTARLTVENLQNLSIYKNSDIIDNILQLGLMEKTNSILYPCNKNCSK
ncbi:MAG: DUF5685 family protein [Clostridiaceae bacterium]